jgi:hypothetical protein
MMREGHLGAEFSARSTVPAAITAERAAGIDTKQARITQYARDHYERSRETWVNRRYAELLNLQGNAPALTPPGLTYNRKAHLMRAAEMMVAGKQASRLALIAKAADRMRGIGRDDGRGR